LFALFSPAVSFQFRFSTSGLKQWLHPAQVLCKILFNRTSSEGARRERGLLSSFTRSFHAFSVGHCCRPNLFWKSRKKARRTPSRSVRLKKREEA
jgi:hypothetical protein